MPTLFTCKHARKAPKGQPSLAVFATLSLLAVLCSPYSVAKAQDDWWFDVEVIVFKRNIELQHIAEKFPLSEPNTVSQPYVDLLTPYIKPDLDILTASMPFCRQSDQRQQVAEQLKTLQSLKVIAYEKADTQEFVPASDAASQLDQPIARNPDSNDDERPVFETLLSVYNETLGLSQPIFDAPFIEWQLPAELPCTYQQPDRLLGNPFEPSALESFVARVAVQINGQERSNARYPHLLPQSALLLSSLFKDINRQKGLSPMLHLAWRQPVLFGRDKAAKFRLFAGNNYAKTYSASGDILATTTPSADEDVDKYPAELEPSGQQTTGFEQDDLFARIYAALAEPSPIVISKDVEDSSPRANSAKKVNELWQLDGEFKVYLQYVGRTPYLHIDSDLDYRIPIFVENKPYVLGDSIVGLAPVNDRLAAESDAVLVGDTPSQPNYLQSVNFNQLRRVISKQLHYFDHPLFGMVVHIKRYKWPEPETEVANSQQATEN